jgi:hypothetical protein
VLEARRLDLSLDMVSARLRPLPMFLGVRFGFILVLSSLIGRGGKQKITKAIEKPDDSLSPW